jgi:hypothetical protein
MLLFLTECAGPDGPSHLLNLPEDVLHVLLGRLPPRSLALLGGTCQLLRHELVNDSIWRSSYVNHFLWDGAARSEKTRQEVKVLVQGCSEMGNRGWRKEALEREANLEWVF